SRPPATAANRIPTPNGRLHCQARNVICVDTVFCAMKINSTMRIRKPTISATHNAAARVNLTADWGAAGGLDSTLAGLDSTGASEAPPGQLAVVGEAAARRIWVAQ